MEALVQSLLANTSTQAFFSPDPDDADTIRAILSSSHRYGDITLDLPTLQCWLRARIKWTLAAAHTGTHPTRRIE